MLAPIPETTLYLGPRSLTGKHTLVIPIAEFWGNFHHGEGDFRVFSSSNWISKLLSVGVVQRRHVYWHVCEISENFRNAGAVFSSIDLRDQDLRRAKSFLEFYDVVRRS